jgi:hypothetical protein
MLFSRTRQTFILHEELNTMSDIHYFPGGYEVEKHDRVLFGLLGGHDETHIHFDASAGAPAKDVWDKNTQVLGGLLAHTHDLHVHQNARAGGGGETDIRVHDGSVLGGLVLDDHKSDFKTKRMTAKGLETHESHESSGCSLGGIIAEGSNTTEKTSIRGADGVTRTEIKHESEGSVLGGIIGASNDKSDACQVTTGDGKTLTTHLCQDSSGEALGGLLAQGQEHTEFVDNGQGRIGIHTAEGTVLGGVIYAQDSSKVYGTDLPGAQQYIDVPSPYPQALPAQDRSLPALSENSYNGPNPSIAAGAEANMPPTLISQSDVTIPPAQLPTGSMPSDGPLGQARQQVVKNFIDPDTNNPINQASILRFDNSDYFLADGHNVRFFDSNNQRVNFVQEGPVAVAQSVKGDDMVLDPVTNRETPRLSAKVTDDGKGVEFDFAQGLSVSADKDGDYRISQVAVPASIVPQAPATDQ